MLHFQEKRLELVRHFAARVASLIKEAAPITKSISEFPALRVRRLGRFPWAILAFGVFPLFLPLAMTVFGGAEGYSSLAIIALEHFKSVSPNTIVD